MISDLGQHQKIAQLLERHVGGSVNLECLPRVLLGAYRVIQSEVYLCLVAQVCGCLHIQAHLSIDLLGLGVETECPWEIAEVPIKRRQRFQVACLVLPQPLFASSGECAVQHRKCPSRLSQASVRGAELSQRSLLSGRIIDARVE